VGKTWYLNINELLSLLLFNLTKFDKHKLIIILMNSLQKKSYIESQTFKSMPPIDLANATKDQFKEYLLNSFYLYEYLFSSLVNEEAHHQCPEPLRRNLIFYIGHTASLYLNKLKLIKVAESKNEFFEDIFAVGVDPITADELDHHNYISIWPKLEEIYKYRREILDLILELIDKHDLILPVQKDTFYWIVLLSIEHERIHFETTTLLFRQLDLKYLKKPEKWNYAKYSTEFFPENEFIQIMQPHKIKLGKPDTFPTFGWDNEYGDITLVTKPIKITKFKITNGEYLEFVKSGGYRQKIYWGTEGWEWLQRTDKNTWKKEIIDYPLFWIKDTTAKYGFKLRLVFDEIELPLNWPVEVSYHEAKAYCAWLQEKNRLTHSFYRVIKEEEFKLIRGDEIIVEKNNLNGAQRDFVAYDWELGNTNCQFISPTPVDKYPPSPLGFYDTVGNVWEWTESYFRPFPGYKPETYYYDYSGPCFDYYHNNIIGSAWSSTGMSASCYVRFGFRRHFYQNCGFRVVEEDYLRPLENNPYENKKIIGEYMISNYYDSSPEKTLFGNIKLDLEMNYKDFNTKIAEHAVHYYLQLNNLKNIDDLSLKALDLGCGVGKSTFELARYCKQVTGLEFSKSFVDICNTLKETGQFNYEYKIQSENYQEATAVIDPQIDRSRVEFIHGDACNLPNELGPFDLIILINLLDRTQNPRQCLIDLHNKLNKNGVLIISSPFTWMEEYTPKEFWIGAKDGVSSFDALKELMESFCFNLADHRVVSMILREHCLKYQLNLSMMTVWTKKKFSEEFASSIFKN